MYSFYHKQLIASIMQLICNVFNKKERMSTIMAIEVRNHNGKKQYRFRCYYQDMYGNRKQKNSKLYETKKEAKKQESLFITTYNDNNFSIKFYDLALNWLEFTRKNNAASTTADKESVIENRFKPLRNIKINEITSSMCKRFFEDKEIAKLSVSRKNTYHCYLHSIFRHGNIFFGTNGNPIDAIPRFKEKKLNLDDPYSIYTPEEFKIFEENFDDDREKYRDFFHMLFWTGMRKNECRSLKFSAFRKKYVYVYRQIKKNKFENLKTKESVRKINLSDSCLSIVRKQYKKYKNFPGFNDEWFIFGGYKPLSLTSIARAKEKADKKKRITCYQNS